MKITADKARTLAARDHHPGQNPYVILSGYGIQPPYPEHRASNDTEVMRRLFLSLGVAPDFFDAPKPKKRKKKPPVPKADRRKLNQQMLERTGYNFVYLKNSPVFHRRDCKICLAAKSTAEILGSVYYETAAEARRPCRVCNPVPLVSHEKYEKRKQLSDQREEFAETVVTVKTITGEVIAVKPKKIYGWCHYRLHRGALTKALMKEHDCLGKNCRNLERNAQCPFWEEQEKKKRAKAEHKRKQNAEEERLQLLSKNWQLYHILFLQQNNQIAFHKASKYTAYQFILSNILVGRSARGKRYDSRFSSSVRDRRHAQAPGG